MIDVLEYLDEKGESPFRVWFDKLDPQAAARVAIAEVRVARGNLSNAKGIGEGVFEIRLDFGQGYRIYFGKDGATIVILLGGGTKRRQQDDIEAAKSRWLDYKRRKKKEQ